MEPFTYKKAGVDTQKADQILEKFSSFLKGRPKDTKVLSGIGGFAACYRLGPHLKDYKDPLLVTCCDGVGTKVKLALEWEELKGLGQDLVAMNVNDLICVGAKPIQFLDYYACGRLSEDQLLPILKSIQSACELSECALIGGETAEMPGIYQDRDFDLAGFAVGLVDRNQVLGAEKVKEGDVVIGLSSSGLHSNGFSLVRKIVEREKLEASAKTPFGSTWKEVLLKPTQIYWPFIKDVLANIHAAAHITGGGLFENLPRVLPQKTRAVIDGKKWPESPLFSWFQEKSGLKTQEFLTTLNCGVGMALLVAPDKVKTLLSHFEKTKLPAFELGHIEKSDSTEPEIQWK